MTRRYSRREFLRKIGFLGAGLAFAAATSGCGTSIPTNIPIETKQPTNIPTKILTPNVYISEMEKYPCNNQGDSIDHVVIRYPLEVSNTEGLDWIEYIVRRGPCAHGFTGPVDNTDINYIISVSLKGRQKGLDLQRFRGEKIGDDYKLFAEDTEIAKKLRGLGDRLLEIYDACDGDLDCANEKLKREYLNEATAYGKIIRNFLTTEGLSLMTKYDK